MSDFKDFIKRCESKFSFLSDKYGFEVEKNQQDRWERKWVQEFRLKNNTTGVRVIFERRDFRFFIFLCRLIEGDFAKDSSKITMDAILNEYDLDDLLSIRAPDLIWPPHPSNLIGSAELIDKMLSHEADCLNKYAQDILQGDFSIFSKLEKIVKQRAREDTD